MVAIHLWRRKSSGLLLIFPGQNASGVDFRDRAEGCFKVTRRVSEGPSQDGLSLAHASGYQNDPNQKLICPGLRGFFGRRLVQRADRLKCLVFCLAPLIEDASMVSRIGFTFALVGFLSLVANAQAKFTELDSVQMKSGGYIAGKVVPKESGIVVYVDSDLSVFVPKDRFSVKLSSRLDEYRRRVVLAGNDAEKHYELGIWCKKNGLEAQNKYHYQRTIALDSDHSKARSNLGYTRNATSGKWVLYSDNQRNLGLVLQDRKWQLPENVARAKMQKEANVAANKWNSELKKMVKIVLRNNSKSSETLQKIKDIEDPLAAGAVAEQLSDSRKSKNQSRALRQLWIELLGRFKNTVAVQALVETGIEESDDSIREAAMESLAEYGHQAAVATYLGIIKSGDKSNLLVRRALRGLSYFPNPELALDYVDALTTVHTQAVPQGPGLSVGQVNGQSGLATGGKKEPKKEAKNNAGALTLLKMVEPGVDYGYDQNAWRQHFASKLTGFEGSLRRDN